MLADGDKIRAKNVVIATGLSHELGTGACRCLARARRIRTCCSKNIPPGTNWFFHRYCNGASDCLAGFTGMKLRSYPSPRARSTVQASGFQPGHRGPVSHVRGRQRSRRCESSHRDLTGQSVRRSKQVDGRVPVVEPDDLRASVNYLRRGELSVYGCCVRSRGGRNSPGSTGMIPCHLLMVWVRFAVRGVRKMLPIVLFNSHATCQSISMDKER
ncbi:hypothetical protein ACVMAJ_001439 [Bradyrhizobium sp. USDA 4448]